ncbi:MAG TPA: cytochrome c [Acidimicrobiales bacterium]|nr:cytochrome c [Acidimicrobiales bacterium]
MIFAASTQRNIGLVIATIVIVGFVLFVFFNLREAREEIGAEVELAPNRKPYLSDEELENTKLNRSLLFSLVMLATIAVGLPAYWLAEPARQENALTGVLRKDATRGEVLFESNCQSCHNPGGVGGVAPYTLTDEAEGRFVAQVQWIAPALTSVYTRFDETEVRYILNYGRGVMPAWGTIGGGPMTEQQITELIVYLRTIQDIGDEGEKKVQDQVMSGVLAMAKADVLRENSTLAAQATAIAADEATAASLQAEIDRTTEAFRRDLLTATRAQLQAKITAAREKLDDEADVAAQARVDTIARAPEGSPSQALYGKYLFSNPASSGQYNCARCHTKGWSYNGEEVENRNGEPLFPSGLIPGGGFFGPNLTNGVTTRQFEISETHEDFIASGSQTGVRYGQYGQGSGRMPGFGARTQASCEIPPDPGEGGPPVADCAYPAILTPEQIAAIVAYERSL